MDLEGVVMRWLFLILRVVYCVSGLFVLWYIDGNYKLIRWVLFVSIIKSYCVYIYYFNIGKCWLVVFVVGLVLYFKNGCEGDVGSEDNRIVKYGYVYFLILDGGL